MTLMQLTTKSGEQLELGEQINAGGEAEIWSIRREPHLIAKLYHQPSDEREAKLTTMLMCPPSQPRTHRAIAWPTDLIYRDGCFSGFVMPKVHDCRSVFHYYNPVRRTRLPQIVPWRYFLHRVAYNLASAIEAVHAQGHIVGDLNEGNVLVNSQALVTLVDTDSFQVRISNGTSPNGTNLKSQNQSTLVSQSNLQFYRSTVGKAEFTAPEMQGVDFKSVDRGPEQDYFGLAVMLFYLLMEGVHPFAGVLTTPHSTERVDLHCVRKGLFPHRPNLEVTPPPSAPSVALLAPNLQELFIQCFVRGHHHAQRRPSATEWRKGLKGAEEALIACESDREHIYSAHLRDCPFCKPETIPHVRVPVSIQVQKIVRSKRVHAMRTKITEIDANDLWQILQHNSKVALSTLASTASTAGGKLSVIPTQMSETVRTWRVILAQQGSLGLSWLIANLLGGGGAIVVLFILSYFTNPFEQAATSVMTNSEAITSIDRWLILLNGAAPAAVFGMAQWLGVRHRVFIHSRDGLLWVATFCLAGGGAATVAHFLMRFDITEHLGELWMGIDIGLVAMTFGTIVGVLQWLLLRQRLVRARQRYGWILVCAWGWISIGYCLLVGINNQLPGILTGDMTGGAALLASQIFWAFVGIGLYTLITGGLLVWMCSERRFVAQIRFWHALVHLRISPRRAKSHLRGFLFQSGWIALYIVLGLLVFQFLYISLLSVSQL